jgi:hypothetical protein
MATISATVTTFIAHASFRVRSGYQRQ